MKEELCGLEVSLGDDGLGCIEEFTILWLWEFDPREKVRDDAFKERNIRREKLEGERERGREREGGREIINCKGGPLYVIM